MPVIINEVEVIAPPQPPSDRPAQAQQEPAKATGPTPRDIYRITRKLVERRMRLLAR